MSANSPLCPDGTSSLPSCDGVLVIVADDIHTGTCTITKIEQIPIVVPLGREYKGSYYSMTHRVTVLTRVHTAEGLIGTAYVADEEHTLQEIVKVVERDIAPRLIGENALAIERLWELCYPVTFDQLRDRRIGLVALAGIDTALWDLFGQAVQRPLVELWGGYRNRLPVNIIGGYYGPLDDVAGEVADEVGEWLDMGFRGCKFKLGAQPVAVDAARVRACRETAGDDFVITIDANQGYTLAAALELCDSVREYDIRWFEEPCRWANDARDMREVRARGAIPVCAGQSEYSPEGCRDLMEAGAIDVCNFDSSWAGGPTNWRRNAAVAHVYGVELAHHEEPHVAAHLLASQPHGTFLEVFHPDRDPIWWNLILNRPAIVDGQIELPTGPGLGWEYDFGFIDRYRADR